MYHTFYHLRHDPFASTPDPALFFASASHQAALQGIIDGIAYGQSCVTLLGKSGLGKTLLLRAYLERLDPQRLTAVSVVYAHLAFDDILKMLCQALGIRGVSNDTAATMQVVHQVLRIQEGHGRRVILLIDEAHHLSKQTLERVLQLLNFYTPTGESLLQIVFAGLPEFWHALHAVRAQHRRFAPGLVVTLSGLTFKESMEYMQYRLQAMSSSVERVFSATTAKKITILARGNPGLLNTLCTNVLIAGALHHQKPVALPLAHEVLATYEPKRVAWQRGAVYAAGALLVAGLYGGVQYSAMHFLSTEVVPPVPFAQPLPETWHASPTQPPANGAWHTDASAALARAPQEAAQEAPPGVSPRPAGAAKAALPEQTALVMPDVPPAVPAATEARMASHPPGQGPPPDGARSLPPEEVSRRLAALRAHYRAGAQRGGPPALASAPPAAPPGQTAAGREWGSSSVAWSATTSAPTDVKPVPAPQWRAQPAPTSSKGDRRQDPRRAGAAATVSPALQQGKERRRIHEKQGDPPVERALPSRALLETGHVQDNAGRAQERPGVPRSLPPEEVSRRLAALRAHYRAGVVF